MGYEGFRYIETNIDEGVAYVTFNNSPINLIDKNLFKELLRIEPLLAKDDSVKVIVFQSKNPDYFLAHFDVTLLDHPHGPVNDIEKAQTLTQFHQLLENFRNMNKVTIAKITGRARGGGSEFVLALDMRFGAIDSTILSQLEIIMGFPPGGGALQRLTKLTGRGRALEILLSGMDYDAVTAEKYGWLNRALPKDELDSFVDNMAKRMASYPPEAIGILKEAFNKVQETTTIDGLLEEAFYFGKALRTPEAKRRIKRFMELGGQTYDRELDLNTMHQDIKIDSK
ncbi:enoyl-CoA hydratase/isomerase family protein [Alkalihalobacterium alkalinitrilicum]|uniref:enoyl-CoA hydratase/isomerase family protein n=1 Tax=Alkalihalobacterium alkalinitrilicum TaxID=427920 RepID=UPI0009957F06|nr:enoyl-CoA hydratase/isomerase family protein [Alkalihalobacterium alkalinitrilicum]